LYAACVLQPQPNHNGGTLLFAPTQDNNAAFYDLYITAGDGGGAKYVRQYIMSVTEMAVTLFNDFVLSEL
jgi:hypothetical protein